MSAWLVIALVFAVLVVFWQLLDLTFDLIAHWQAAHEQEREDAQATKGKGSSVL